MGSEMVSDPKDAAGKAFFAFEFVAAIFIFLAYYPYQLDNVYIGDDDIAFCGLSYTVLRQFIPAPGMMLVATVTTTPFARATLRDDFTITIHLVGAIMMFLGYMLVEAKTLGLLCFSHPTIRILDRISVREAWWRRFFLMQIALWWGAFLVFQVILGFPGIDKYICCNDEYNTDFTPPKLINTASSTFLFLKVFSYLSKVICGWSLIMSHATIWYFCEERHLDLEDTLTEMGKVTDELST